MTSARAGANRVSRSAPSWWMLGHCVRASGGIGVVPEDLRHRDAVEPAGRAARDGAPEGQRPPALQLDDATEGERLALEERRARILDVFVAPEGVADRARPRELARQHPGVLDRAARPLA